ncbi:TetR/AcrR family transcriptional regulator [Mycobacterium sp. UM_CSW]|uniref:TetR/AcrR family transcriptional regulator n=1 Tax=Mycobacterium sp. UM_CSW TaxID=1370119 RepID=UPI0008311EAF|nr:TetR/AcrR family transcriptional regulator [Mycobacterium sp. UM_CSW]
MSTERVAPQRPPIRESQKAATAKVLLDASEELFFEQGYTATTIGQIAARAGASRATFYLHFDAKWRTVAELARLKLVPETIDFYRRLDAHTDISRHDMRSWLDDALEFYVRNRDLVLIVVQVLQLEPEFAAENERIVRTFAAEMPHLLQRWGPDRRAEVHLRLGLLISQLSDFAAGWLTGIWNGVDRAVAIDVLTDFWMAGLRAQG